MMCYLILPAYSEVTPDVVDVTAWLTPSISRNIPLVSAGGSADRVRDGHFHGRRAGGIGIVHKNMSIERQKLEIEKVKKSESGMIIDPITVQARRHHQTRGLIPSLLPHVGLPVVKKRSWSAS